MAIQMTGLVVFSLHPSASWGPSLGRSHRMWTTNYHKIYPSQIEYYNVTSTLEPQQSIIHHQLIINAVVFQAVRIKSSTTIDRNLEKIEVTVSSLFKVQLQNSLSRPITAKPYFKISNTYIK